jgi:hypothetical protein
LKPPASRADTTVVAVAYCTVIAGYVGAGLGLALVWALAQLLPRRRERDEVPSVGQAQKLDVLLLLIAVGLNGLVELPASAVLFAMAIFGAVGLGVARTSPPGDRLPHAAALLASVFALMLAEEAGKLFLYGGGDDIPGRPSASTHAGFHELVEAGILGGAVLLVLVTAWAGLRRAAPAISIGYAVSSLPIAVIALATAALALSADPPYSLVHPYVWLIVLFGFASAAAALLITRTRATAP